MLERKPKIKLKIPLNLKPPKKLKVKVDKRLSKVLLVLVGVIVAGGLLYSAKSWFVVAVVNGRPIFRHAFDRQLERQYGKATLDNEVTKVLIQQEAKKQNTNIPQSEVDDRIKQIEDQFKAQGTDLDTLLTSQGQNRDNLQEQIKIQLVIEKILGKDIEITDEQIEQYYETNKDFFPEDSKFEDLKEDIRQDVFQQQMSEKFQPWLEDLKATAKIYPFLVF